MGFGYRWPNKWDWKKIWCRWITGHSIHFPDGERPYNICTRCTAVESYHGDFNRPNLHSIFVQLKANFNHMNNQSIKPPIALVPKAIRQEQRFSEVCEAITRYYNNKIKIPVEWVEEYNELIDIIHPNEQQKTA